MNTKQGIETQQPDTEILHFEVAPNPCRKLLEDTKLKIPLHKKRERILEGLAEITAQIVHGTGFQERFDEALSNIKIGKEGSKDLEEHNKGVTSLNLCLEHTYNSEKADATFTYHVPGSEDQILIHLGFGSKRSLSISVKCGDLDGITHEDYDEVGQSFNNLKDSI